MRSIFIMSFTDLSRDSRVRRQIQAVLNEHCVITCGTRPSSFSVSGHIPYIQRKKSFFQRFFSFFYLLTRNYEQYLKAKGDVRQVLSKISIQQVDVIVANDVETLPAAYALKRQKQSEKMKARWSDPEYKKRILDARYPEKGTEKQETPTE